MATLANYIVLTVTANVPIYENIDNRLNIDKSIQMNFLVRIFFNLNTNRWAVFFLFFFVRKMRPCPSFLHSVPDWSVSESGME